MANGRQDAMASARSGHNLQKSLIIQGRYLQYALLAVFFVMTFRTLQSFPGMSVIKELWLLIMFGFLAIPYLHWKASSGWRFLPFELYILAMMALIPLLSGIAAWREFGQPLIYGVLSQRTNVLGAGALFILYAFRKELIALREIQGALLFLAWTTLGLYLFMTIFVDPASLVDFGRGFVGGGSVKAYEFKFRTEFIIFGFFFYAFLGFRTKSRHYWLLSLPFIAYLVVIEGGRSLIASMIASFVILTFRWGSFPRLVAFLPKILLAGLLLLVLLYASNAEYVKHLAGKFNDAITVVTIGEKTEDHSANARLVETAIAVPYIRKHWLLGNGDLSKQWHGGYEGVLGRFYPSDIGIIGVMYMYGVFGTLLFAAQFLFAFRFSRQASVVEGTIPLLDAINGFLLYFVIHSLVTGRFAHYSEISFMLIALLYCIVLEIRKQRLSGGEINGSWK